MSKSAANGFGAGSDSNTLLQAQDRATPFATIYKAMQNVANGGYVVVNDGVYSGTDLAASGGVLLIDGNTQRMATIKAHRFGQVSLLGTNATYLVRISALATAGLTLTLDGLALDAATVSQYCIGDTVVTGNAFTVNLVNCTFLNPTLRAVSASSTKHVYNIVNPLHIAGASRAFFYSNTPTSGCSLTITGGSSTISQQNNPQAVVEYRATAAGASASISGLTINSTLLSSLTGTGSHDAVWLSNISTLSVTDSNLSVTGLYGSRAAAIIRATADAAIDVAATILRNVIFNGTTGGYGILIGSDGTSAGDARCNNPVVTGNRVTGLATQVTALHGILLGFQEGGTVSGNELVGCALPLIQKKNVTTGALFVNNTIRHLAEGYPSVGYTLCMYGKGSVGTRFEHNSVYINDSSARPINVEHVQPDDVSGTAATGVVFKNNAIHMTGSNAALKFVNVLTGSTATFANNLYFSTNALPANCFTYQASSYSTVAAWVAAQEATAVTGDPKFVDAVNDNFRLTAGSACISAGVAVGGITTDKAGVAYASPPSIGAYEYAA